MFELNPNKIREDFPILKKGVIYFDSACMSLKPKQVVEKMNEYYNEYPACSGRSGHKLSKKVEYEIDSVRTEIRKMIGAKEDCEIVFTRNTTEGINLVANSFKLEKGDEVIVSDKEHNSNLIAWLKLKEKGIKVVISKTNSDNTFNLENFKKCFSGKTKLVSVVHVSNLDGVENPIREIAKITHEHGAVLVVDGAQSFPHMEINVRDLGIDFLACSGHKALGPTGTGFLYGKKELLEKLSPFILGGHTVIDSTYENYKLEKIPDRFEAGLLDYAGIIGFGEACRYLKKVGLGKIKKHEIKLNKLVTEELSKNEKIEIIGPEDAEMRGGIFTFNIKGIDSHDVAKMLDSSKNIAVRSGAFCVHSWFNNQKIKGAVRASFYLYNTEEEARLFIEEVNKISKFA